MLIKRTMEEIKIGFMFLVANEMDTLTHTKRVLDECRLMRPDVVGFTLLICHPGFELSCVTYDVMTTLWLGFCQMDFWAKTFGDAKSERVRCIFAVEIQQLCIVQIGRWESHKYALILALQYGKVKTSFKIFLAKLVVI